MTDTDLLPTQLGKDYDKVMYDSYFALQNSPIFQEMLRYTIERNLPDLAGKTAYDNGFGAGFSLNIMLNRGLKSYTGLDLSSAMTPYLTQHAAETDPDTEVVFLRGDNTDAFSDLKRSPVHFTISSYAMYVDSIEKLNGFTKHLFESTRADGEVLLMVIHPDYEHTRERLAVLARYGNILEPELPEGDSYGEFSPYQIRCVPPYFKNEIEFEEYVVGSATLLASLRRAGFASIEDVDIEAAPGHEDLLEFAQAFNLAIYRCLK